MSRTGVCDRCHKNINPSDEEAVQLLNAEMDDTWEGTGKCGTEMDLCGKCYLMLKRWLLNPRPRYNFKEQAEALFEDMSKIKTNGPDGLLGSAVMCDYAGKRAFIDWLTRRLGEMNAGFLHDGDGQTEASEDLV